VGNAIASFHISTCHRAADVEKGEIMNDEMKRWTASRKAEVVISMLKHEVNIVDVCRQHDLKQSEVQSWIDEFVKSGTTGLKINSKEAVIQHRKEVKQLQAKIGELVMELEARKKWEAMLRDQQEDNS